jgi:hypothetical protein
MLRDVFYFGNKPNSHPREQHANDLAHARSLSTTEHFWVITEHSDYKNFDWDWDFDFLPDEDVWTRDFNNVWPSETDKDSGTWLCTELDVDTFIYRTDVQPIKLKKDESWKFLSPVDPTSIDLSWKPDPSEPPYIYTWGNKYIPAEIEPTLEYHVDGAVDRKYMGNVRVFPQTSRWKEYVNVDSSKFDFNWRPDPREPAFIYVWGSKFDTVQIKPVVEYHVPGATDRKYMDEIVELVPEYDRWKEHTKVSNFDFSWRPSVNEPPFIYVWGNKYEPAEIKPTLEYIVPGATEKKYMGDVLVEPEYDRWTEFVKVTNTFDMSWRPSPREPAFIYIWGNKYEPAEIKPTIQYIVPGATEKKYMGIVDVEPEYDRWTEHIKVSVDFDKSWRPDPREPAFIYVWGNKYDPAEVKPTIEYVVPGATDKKFMGVVDLEPEWDRWKEHILVDRTTFDFSWRPDPNLHEPPFIYVWGNKFHPAEQKPTIEYIVPGATEKKYMGIVDLAPEWDRWNILVPIDMSSFDFRWRPDPNLHEPPLVYVFGNKWHDSKTEPTIEYIVPEATVKKYMDYPVAIPKSDMSLWIVNNKEDLDTFDFSWRPNPHSPPQTYQWVDNGPRYIHPNANEVVLMEYVDDNRKVSVNRYVIKTTLEELISEHLDEVFWALNPDLTYDRFDFNWRPTNENFRHINVFGNEYSKNTQTYYINGPMHKLGHREMNYVVDQTVDIESNLSMFYIDRGRGSDRYDALKLRYPQLQKTRYLNSWVETIQRCVNKSETKLFWVLNSELDYSEFMFDFYPSPWQMDMVHVFGTQWSHWGNTYLVNSETFEDSTKYIKVIEHLNILNFVKTKRAQAVEVLYDIVYIDHGNLSNEDYNDIECEGRLMVKYDTSYLNTLKTMVSLLPIKKEHYVWVVSTICEYFGFDFTYICDPYAKDQLHVFPSDKQKFGDTFLVDVNKLRTLVDEMVVLEDYVKVNYNQHQVAKRLPAPIIINESDTHVSINDFNFNWPYATILSSDNKEIKVTDNEPMSLWSSETKNITVHSAGGTYITVPKEAKNYVKKELYDYPYIKRMDKLARSNPLDIIFFSNGEASADDNYEHLLFATAGLSNRVIRVDGINGRVASQHAAANASNTPWYFLVNAKLRVNEKFDWDWQPDRLQIPKHYIFTATNPVNHLEYGHQAIVANNKNITLNTVAKGLDFTMDGEHEVVQINSGIGMYNTSVWDTWRTAFREVLKLKYYTEHNDDLEAKFRLSSWLNLSSGKFGEYSTMAARDACEYYDSVNGDLGKLRLSYDWAWLKTYYEGKK